MAYKQPWIATIAERVKQQTQSPAPSRSLHEKIRRALPTPYMDRRITPGGRSWHALMAQGIKPGVIQGRMPTAEERTAWKKKTPPPAHGWGRRASQMARFVGVQQIPPKMLPILRARGGTYLGEDESFYYWMEPGGSNELGGFFDKIGNVFKKIPKAFAPKNLYKTFIDTTLTVASGGLYLAAGKKLKSQIRGVANYAVPAIAGGVLAYTAGPAVMGMLMPKLKAAGSLISSGAGKVFGGVGKLFGGGGQQQDITGQDYGGMIERAGTSSGPGAIDKALTIGGSLINFLQRLPQHKQAEVVERMTPQDIAYMEQYGQPPPHLRNYFESMGQGPVQPMTAGGGYESLYPGAATQEGDLKPVEAGMFGGMNPMTIGLLVGVPAVFFLFQQSGKK